MKATFKPLALTAAVAAATAGSASVYAQAPAGELPTLGDFAIVPYYTVREGWVTGIHIINTSATDTVAVKFRMRQALDSADVFDFNIVLSPYDVWTGNIRGDETNIEVSTGDNSCTVPVALVEDGVASLDGAIVDLDLASEGYVEVIAMGATTADQPAAAAAVHVAGEPVNCNAVESNFRVANLDPDAQITTQASAVAALNGTTAWTDAGNVLKVSYFIRDADSGIEFGNNAVHIADFQTQSLGMMTHQQYGLESFTTQGIDALDGFDFPDVNGGGCGNDGTTCVFTTADYRGKYDSVVRLALGAEKIINEWSYNTATGASTDWVVTFPGQYNMIDIWSPLATKPSFTDIPVETTFRVLDREEQGAIPGGLNFSPSPAPDVGFLPNEVNVVTWGSTVPPVLDSSEDNVTNVDPAEAGIDAPFGWAELTVAGKPAQTCDQGAADLLGASTADRCVAVVNTTVPIIGFTAWQRTFTDASKNYGRLIEHSFVGSSGTATAPTPSP